MTDQAPEPKPKRQKKGFTAYEIVEQTDRVRDWLAQGLRPHQIRKLCAEKWGLATRTAEFRIKNARECMVRDLEDCDRKEKAAELLEAASQILKAAQDSNQLSNAIGALSFSARLLGLEGRQN